MCMCVCFCVYVRLTIAMATRVEQDSKDSHTRARDLCTDATNYGLGATVTATASPSSCLCVRLCLSLCVCVWSALCVHVCLHLRLHLNLFSVLNAAQKLCQMKFMRCARKTTVKTNSHMRWQCVCAFLTRGNCVCIPSRSSFSRTQLPRNFRLLARFCLSS